MMTRETQGTRNLASDLDSIIGASAEEITETWLPTVLANQPVYIPSDLASRADTLLDGRMAADTAIIVPQASPMACQAALMAPAGCPEISYPTHVTPRGLARSVTPTQVRLASEATRAY